MTLEKSIYLFFSLIFLHIIVEFYLQGIFMNIKRQEWWQELEIPTNIKTIYKTDYKAGLYIYGFFWSFFLHLAPFAFLYNQSWWLLYVSLLVHTFIRAFVDDLKVNRYRINTKQEQIIFIIQIFTISLLTLILI